MHVTIENFGKHRFCVLDRTVPRQLVLQCLQLLRFLVQLKQLGAVFVRLRLILRVGIISVAKQDIEQIAFGPNNAVNRHAGCAADCTHGVSLASTAVRLRHTVETLGDAWRMQCGLSQQARSSRLDQRLLGNHTHFVDVAARVDIVERINYNVKIVEILGRESLIGNDVCMKRLQIECFLVSRYKLRNGLARHDGLALLDVPRAKQKLTVQIAQVDRIEINHVNFLVAGNDQVLQ